ncbi:DNA-binding WRKY [Corchorus capsularis]|uniref:DNA-binding WRKY n=1 Tax=Corchorus capsularis TaxID=210143 RepID=A0A1R3IL01_COCAP|nr:DNA-binding WRKY [Corchorus capsularis]
MENYQGDLNDIVRGGPMGCGGGGGGGGAGHQAALDVHVPSATSSTWQNQNQGFPCVDSDPLNFSSSALEDHRDDRVVINHNFGDPFSTMRDPLLHELNVAANSTTYFGSSPNSAIDNNNNNNNNNKIFEEELRSPAACNIFSRIQISPNSNKLAAVAMSPCDSSPPMMAAGAGGVGIGVSPRGGIKAPAALGSDMIINGGNSSKSCLIDNTGAAGSLQISSPRNLGIKRRKSQAKKVVCIPAPAAANSRSSGEVVPSDLWAWRKYGQKPIKGSPYPRGYYRCSSSKGCSARKQVERSRTDPNMLVITYTSEHNHPWPTQRNALAGSTRSQPSKTNNNASKTSPTSQQQNQNTLLNPKEEVKENIDEALSPTVGPSSTASASVKEEIEIEDIDHHKQDDAADQIFVEAAGGNNSNMAQQTYRPAMAEGSNSEDFFADLDEIETDHLNLLFPQGFSAEDHGEEQQKDQNKAMDPFSLFDWPSGDNNPSF